MGCRITSVLERVTVDELSALRMCRLMGKDLGSHTILQSQGTGRPEGLIALAVDG